MDVSPSHHAERRIVSVLFADLVGSTAVAEQVDPEDWGDLAGAALQAMSNAVERYGGVVARLMGDGILALFGAPVASEDDAERAVRAGLDLVGLGPELRSRAVTAGVSLLPDQLLVRVGIATGDVVAGTVGSARSSEYTVLGDAANLAARLEKLAPPGGVLIGDATRRSVGVDLELEARPGLMVRGKQDAVDAYLVVGVQSRTLGRAARRGAFVGRQGELERLVALVDRCVAGQGSIATILGEGGIGKSRLLDEIEDVSRARHPDLAFIRTSVSSYETDVVYAPIRRVLTGLAGLGDLDDHLSGLPGERQMVVQAAMAALERDAAGETDAGEMRLALSEYVEAVTGARGALVMVLDDLQWADAASVELLGGALPLTERQPLMIVLALRPETSSAAWAIRHHAETEFPHRHTDVRLGPLGDAASRDVVRHLAHPAPSDLVDALVARAGGNPFFLEELARESIETGDRGRVPATLQRLMQARFDRISEGGRVVLEIAAVAGETVTERMLEGMLGRPMAEALHELMRSGILEPDPGTPRTYRFVHSLARESAYQSISRRRRRELHAAVGAALENEGDSVPALLAHQFREAGDAARAARYGLRAADEAARLGAFIDAIRLYDDALASAPDGDPITIALLLGRGRSRDVAGDIGGAITDLEEALRAAPDDDLEWRIRIALGEAWAARDYHQTGRQFTAALDVARRIGDEAMVGTSLNRLGNWYANAVDPEKATELHTEALAVFDRTGSVEGQAATHDLLGMAGLLGGRFHDAHASFRTAVEEFRRLDDIRGTIGALVGSASGAPMYQNLGMPFVEPTQAVEWLNEAVAMARSIGWAAGEAFALFMRSQVQGATGWLGDALTDARTALGIARRIGHHQWEVAALLCLSAAAGDALDAQEAHSAATEAVAKVAAVGSLSWVLEVAAIASRAALATGRLDEAEEVLDHAMARPGAERFGGWHSCVAMQAWAALERGDVSRSKSLLASLDDFSPSLALIEGRVAFEAGDATGAISHFERGAAAAERWSMAPAAWRLHVAAARGGGGEEHLAAAERLLGRSAGSLPADAAVRFRQEARRMLQVDERSESERTL